MSNEKKKKILLLSDDLRMHSGIATMARELVMGTVHKYDWVQIAGAIKNPDAGKVQDLTAATKDLIKRGVIKSDNDNVYVKLYPVDGYGNEDVLFNIMAHEKPDAIIHFTDPRFWGWLYMLENRIRRKVPLLYLNIWDDYPAPMYNRPFYESCDGLYSISKQTMNINRIVLGPKKCCTVNGYYDDDWKECPSDSPDNMKGKTLLHYVPHGINEKLFVPLPKDDKVLVERKTNYFKGKKYNFVLLYNSRNVQRKRTSNIILAYRTFCDSLPKEEAKKCCLVLHTEVMQDAGTNLAAVAEALCPEYDIVFSPSKIPPEEMKYLYNTADVTIALSSNEGFGLSIAESIMCGVPIITTVTGGLQDQIGQVDENGNPVVFDKDFGSNNIKKYENHGVWAKPVWPATRVIQGSIPTPYIFDDLAKWEDAADAMMYWYKMSPENRKKCGLKGREWALGEGGLNAENMCKQFVDATEYLFSHWKPLTGYGMYTVDDYVGNKMVNGAMGFEIPPVDIEKVLKEVDQTVSRL